MAKSRLEIVARGYFDAVGNSADSGLKCDDPTLAVQSSKDECDINFIVNRYMRTGVLPAANHGVYADISEIGDLRESLEQVQFAQEAFMELPAEVRKYFDNDPVKLVEFAQDPRNHEKAIELGLAPPRQPDSVPGAGQAPVGGTNVTPPAKS